MNNRSLGHFWSQATALQGSVTPYIIWHVLAFGLFAVAVRSLSIFLSQNFKFDLGIEASPFEIAGAVLSVLLVFRTNASYERWWEARKLWGGIVNQSRNLTIAGLSYGPRDPEWRAEFVRWVAVFPHVCRASLRAEPPCQRVVELLGPEEAARLEASNHMPGYVQLKIGQLLEQARQSQSLDQFAFLQTDTQKAQLIDHIGACERILKTPLPLVYVINLRRYIVLFLLILPEVLLHRLQSDWLIPLVTMGVAYPVLALDQIGVELQNPFTKKNLSHLPLGEISHNIDRNVHALLAQVQPVERPQAPPPSPPPASPSAAAKVQPTTHPQPA